MSFYEKASLILPVSPAYKDGALQSYKPFTSEGTFTFLRGSNLSATRINKAGLVEKGRENLFLYSNQFSNSAWSKVNSSVAGGKSGYDESNDAWLLTSSSAGGRLQLNRSEDGINTTSAYFKKGSADGVWLRVDLQNTDASVYVNLINGSKINSSGEIATRIADAGNGWYRVELVADWISVNNVRISPINTSGVVVAGSIFIQDAQLEKGLVATDVIETTNAAKTAGILEDLPRLDYSGGATCPSLLLEGARTNIVAQSEYFGSGYWSKNAPLSIVNNYDQSPEGAGNGSRWVSSGGSYPQLGRTFTGLTVGEKYTASFYVKSDGTTQIQHKSWFTGFAGVDFTPTSEWQRINFSITASATTHNFIIFNNNNNAPSSSFLLWGAQIEAGSYPTSYMPTYGATATRAKEAASLVGTNLLDQDNQTLFIEYTKGGIDSNANTIYATSDGTSGANRMQIVDNDDDVHLYSTASGNNILNNINATLLTNLEKGDTIKVAVAMTASSIKAFANGVQKLNFTNSFSWSVTMDDLYIGARGGSTETSKGQGVKQALVFKTALTDAELATLTTLNNVQ